MIDNNNLNPEEDRIKNLLSDFNPKPSDRYYNDLEPSFPWIRKQQGLSWFSSVRQNRWFPVGAAVAAVAIILLILTNLTPMQVAANKLLQFYLPGISETIEIDTPAYNIVLPPGNDLISIDEVEKQRGSEIILPAFIPERFEFSGAKHITDPGISLLYYQDETTGEIIQISLKEYPHDTKRIGPSTEVDNVIIGDTVGEYIHGAWQASEIQEILQDGIIRDDVGISAAWNPDAEIQILRWKIGDILTEILYRGNFADPEKSLDKSVIIAIAQSMEQE